MKIAEIVKLRSGCQRRQVGAVYVVDDRIAATGYNQSASGLKHCSEVGCTIVDGHCIRSIHAEQNGIFNATRAGQSLKDATVYITTFPCLKCLMSLRNVGVRKIVFGELYNYSEAEKSIFEELKNYFVMVQYE